LDNHYHHLPKGKIFTAKSQTEYIFILLSTRLQFLLK